MFSFKLIILKRLVFSQPDMQKDYFCPGTGIGMQKCPDNLIGQIR